MGSKLPGGHSGENKIQMRKKEENKSKNNHSPGIMGGSHPFVAKRIAVDGDHMPFWSGSTVSQLPLLFIMCGLGSKICSVN